MKHILLLISVLMVSKFSGFSQDEGNHITNGPNSMSEYSNYGVSIFFKGQIEIIKNVPEDGAGFFYKSIEIIRFNENMNKTEANIEVNSQHLLSEEGPTLEELQVILDTNRGSINSDSLDSEVEMPSSSDNHISKNKSYSSLSNPFSYYRHLSSLYVMPKMSIKNIQEELKAYVKKHPPYQISEILKKIKIGNKIGLKWRVQNGKTRLDHYLFFGTNNNYLFVSSPYGSNGVIENVILEMELVKTRHSKK